MAASEQRLVGGLGDRYKWRGGEDPRWIVGHGRRRSCGPTTIVDHLDHDHRDVVPAAALVGQANQFLGRLRGVRKTPQNRGHLVLGYLVEQPVAAEQEAVPGEGQHRCAVDRNVEIYSEGPGQDISLGMNGSFVGGELAISNQVLHQAVVVAELHETVIAEEVHPRIADVDPGHFVAIGAFHELDGHQGGAHTVEIPVTSGLLEDGPVGQANRLLEGLQGGLGGMLPGQLNGNGRGHLPALMTTHAIGHAVQRVGRNQQLGILVVGTDLTNVGGRTSAKGCHTSSITVLPT